MDEIIQSWCSDLKKYFLIETPDYKSLKNNLKNADAKTFKFFFIAALSVYYEQNNLQKHKNVIEFEQMYINHNGYIKLKKKIYKGGEDRIDELINIIDTLTKHLENKNI